MIELERNSFKDKVLACWIGKNIGGTFGGPYEGQRDVLDVRELSTPSGKPLPNDDLDLQLVWMRALKDRGPKGVNAQVLGEYWLNYITPYWNEYGIGKGNLTAGLLPPLSGEYRNYWKHSNGAWIRSEVWACCAPAAPDVAMRYALEDACVDHGMGEGTFAALFTAAVESAAFAERDLNRLLDVGLAKLPPDCRVARAIRVAREAYAQGVDWQTAREHVVADSVPELGWFQAPANIGFVVIGLLWGKGDFKESMRIAVNCGDDTDCTGATVGALLGVLGGTAALPADWRAHIGDEIVTIAVNRGACWGIANTCTELTDMVLSVAPCMLLENGADARIGDKDDWRGAETFADDAQAKRLWQRPAYSYDVDFIHTTCTVGYEGEPVPDANGELRVTLTFVNRMPEPRQIRLKWHLPEGVALAEGANCLYLEHDTARLDAKPTVARYTLRFAAPQPPFQRILVEAECTGRATAGYLPVLVLG